MTSTQADKVRTHLQQVVDDPSTKLDARLLESISGDAASALSDQDCVSTIGLVVLLLQSIQQDPSPATRLAESLVVRYSFSDVLALQPPVDLVAGLQAPSPPIQLLVLRILGLAADRVGDVGIIAGKPELVAALVETWLKTTDIAVADKARSVLGALLLTEPGSRLNATSPEYTQGLMSRRVFKDRDVYELLFALPSFKTSQKGDSLPRRDKSIAQGRLLDLLKDVWTLPDVWQSQMPEIESFYGLKAGGLLSFAALHMIDQSDILLRVTQLDFFTDLINSVRKKRSILIRDTDLLDFLTSTGLHAQFLDLYVSPEKHDALDITFLYAPAARYVAAYASNYYEQFLADTTARTKVCKRLHEVLDAVPNSQWARNDGPRHDLHVLVSVPRVVLVSGAITLLRLPDRPASADVFRTLATIFSGRLADDPPDDGDVDGAVLEFPPAQDRRATPAPWAQAEQWAARHLFLAYVNSHPQFWANIVAASSVAAFKDAAVAAVDLMRTVAMARWATEPGPRSFGVDPTVTRASSCPPSPPSTPPRRSSPDADGREGGEWYGSTPPANGVAAVLHPQVLDVLVPFIMGSSLPPSAGLARDPDSAAYAIALAKLRLADALRTQIEALVRRLPDASEEQAMLAELAARLAALVRLGVAGPGAAGIRDAGAEVGTMEL